MLVRKVANDGVEQFGIEDAAGLAQGTAGDSVTAEQTLHLVERAGLLNAPQALDDGIEEEQQEQASILVIEQAPIAGVIACGGIVVQAVEQGPRILKYLSPLRSFSRIGSCGLAAIDASGAQLPKWQEFRLAKR